VHYLGVDRCDCLNYQVELKFSTLPLEITGALLREPLPWTQRNPADSDFSAARFATVGGAAESGGSVLI
jgi:hypothetical protein